MALLVFGDDAAACAAVHTFRKLVRRGDVVLVRCSGRLGYARHLLPYYAAGLVDEVVTVPEGLLEVVDMVDVVSCEEVSIRGGEVVEVRGREYEQPSVLLSIWPRVEGAGVINLLTPEDAERLREALARAEEVVVLGGLAAMPAVDALAAVGLRVSLVWEEACFDEDVSSVIRTELQKAGVRLLAEPPGRDGGRQLVVNYGGGEAPEIPLLPGVRVRRLRVDSGCRLEGGRLAALGAATEVVEPEGSAHAVLCEEEAIAQALNFALREAGLEHAVLRRYFVARFRGRLYASLGLTAREAAALGYDPASTRIRGWGRREGALIKAVASREGRLLGVQAVIDADAGEALGALYAALLSRPRLLELSLALGPMTVEEPYAQTVFSKAFFALLRKAVLGRAVKSLQRLS